MTNAVELGRPNNVIDKFHIEKVKELLNEDRGYTCEELAERVSVSHLTWYENEGDRFLNRIVVIDETWLRSYGPELKSQFAERHAPDLLRLAKFRRKHGNLKQLLIIAYDNRGVLSMTFVVPVGETVNGTYYADFLRTQLRPAIQKKWPTLPNSGVVQIHDSATPHKSNPVKTVFLRSFSPFSWFKKGSCQFLAKECAQYWSNRIED